MFDGYFPLEGVSGKRYPPYGECIYCGSVEGLTNEHIIPLGLGGTLELPQSSCRECAAETSRVEMVVLRGEMWPVRVYLDLQSRRKHVHAPKIYPVTVVRGGKEECVHLPRDGYPILLPFCCFGPPGQAIGMPSRPGIQARGQVTISFGPAPEAVARELGVDSIKININTRPAEFARLIAKIGYAMAAATGSLSLLGAPSPIREIILGKSDNIGDYVGTLNLPLSGYDGCLHRVAVFPDYGIGQLVADVQLFSGSPTPRYVVLLGGLSRF